MDNKLLNDRIGRLKEWQQQESLNEILFNALSSLNAYTKERFDKLTKEIRSETACNTEPPALKIAVCTAENIDQQLFLYPVATEAPFNSPGYITTVFAEGDFCTVQELMRHTFDAQIHSKSGACRLRVTLKYSLKYLQKLQSLYYVFCQNELPWATVKGMYFYKFLDVICEDAAQMPGGMESFEIDFSPYEKYISYDKTLLWNVSPLTVPVASCEAKPAYNTIQFEHTLKNLQFDEHNYLICALGERFTSFKRGQMLIVRTNISQLEQIDLLRITGNEDKDAPLYLPLKSNQKKDGFINALAQGRYIPTHGEAERIIHALGKDVDLQLIDTKILPYTEENTRKYRGLDYNAFLETNALLADKKLLLFTFKTGESKMWAHEIMFFALSELQLYFYEYHCVGEIQ